MQNETRFDYKNQAWTVDGKYVRCGHVDPCDCFGREHEGEEAMTCTKCGNAAHFLEVFPGGKCLACYDADWAPDGKIPDFTKTLNI